MAKARMTYAKLIRMAERYSCADNELFIAAARHYEQQSKLIDEMYAKVKEDGQTVEKEYVKGRPNVTAHPILAEIPKHVDSANRTLNIMLEIITEIGTEPEVEDKLSDFLKNEH